MGGDRRVRDFRRHQFLGRTLDKGWQRLLGTALGVPSGVLVATLVSGNTIASLVMIFVCLFCAFYFMKVTYSLMTFWISTMLALLYGLLGEFTYGLLLLRIEETAIGAVIGIASRCWCCRSTPERRFATMPTCF